MAEMTLYTGQICSSIIAPLDRRGTLRLQAFVFVESGLVRSPLFTQHMAFKPFVVYTYLFRKRQLDHISSF
ncbi:MAG: hypothetical protein O7G87_22115, partial [bacterium]|nr:hypothetical protein [bacterium]